MNAARDCADVGVGLLDGDSVAETGDSIVVMRRAAGIFTVAICRYPDGRILRKQCTIFGIEENECRLDAGGGNNRSASTEITRTRMLCAPYRLPRPVAPARS